MNRKTGGPGRRLRAAGVGGDARHGAGEPGRPGRGCRTGGRTPGRPGRRSGARRCRRARSTNPRSPTTSGRTRTGPTASSRCPTSRWRSRTRRHRCRRNRDRHGRRERRRHRAHADEPRQRLHGRDGRHFTGAGTGAAATATVAASGAVTSVTLGNRGCRLHGPDRLLLGRRRHRDARPGRQRRSRTRTYATDYATAPGTLGPVFVVVPTPMPAAGTRHSRSSTSNQATAGVSPTPSAGEPLPRVRAQGDGRRQRVHGRLGQRRADRPGRGSTPSARS